MSAGAPQWLEAFRTPSSRALMSAHTTPRASLTRPLGAPCPAPPPTGGRISRQPPPTAAQMSQIQILESNPLHTDSVWREWYLRFGSLGSRGSLTETIWAVIWQALGARPFPSGKVLEQRPGKILEEPSLRPVVAMPPKPALLPFNIIKGVGGDTRITSPLSHLPRENTPNKPESHQHHPNHA